MIRTKLWCLCLFVCLFLVASNADNVTSSIDPVRHGKFIDDDDSIVIEAAPVESKRSGRQIDFYQGSWAQALGQGSTCLSSLGLLGSCMTFQNCYPYYKFPMFGLYEPLLGGYDQCTYISETGQQEFGICCSNSVSFIPGFPGQPPQVPGFPGQPPQVPGFPFQPPQSPVPPVQPSPVPPVVAPTPQPVVDIENPQPPSGVNVTDPQDSKLDPVSTAKPPVQSTTLQWPPPIPTHPPNHQAPTHPPFPSWPPQAPTHPSFPTQPTRPPSQSPIYPAFPGWPPLNPQRPPASWPPTTKPPSSWPPASSPPSWPPASSPPSWPPSPSPPSWPPASSPPSWPPTTKPPSSWPPTPSPPSWPPTPSPPSWPPTTKPPPSWPPTTKPPPSWPPTNKPPPSWPPTTKPPPSWPPLQPTRPPVQPTRPPVQPTPPPTAPPTQPPDSGLDNFQAQCGAKNGVLDQERIVGGQSASPNEWPWIVVLFNNGRQFCGGSLLDGIHILTAAHCVAHMSSWDVARLKAHLGDHNIKTSTEVQHVERAIKRVVRHRGFDSRTLYNDVAILTMDRPVEFTRNVRPICLPSGSALHTGKVATVIGWGSLRENGQQPSILQKVSIPIWTNQDCSLKYGPAAPGGIIETMLCAGENAKDSCSGDSGGPLMINEGKWIQVGIVSWGIGCGKGQYPGVYSRVTHFLPWIRKNLDANF